MSDAITPANITYSKGNVYNNSFDDIYFDRNNGLFESQYIYLQQNKIEQRIKTAPQFVIGETGFGTGLNFFATLELWHKTASNMPLYYISVEKYPLLKDDFAAISSHWPEIQSFADQVVSCYPEAVHGFHKREFFNNKVTLLILYGDVVEMLCQLDVVCDAWYLDGFAPNKNKSMWSQPVFEQVARLSHIGTTFSTFTVAGNVRRGLQNAGFECQKIPGFGAKKQILSGRLVSARKTKPDSPWYSLPRKMVQSKDAVVIGAGIAGTSMANSLAKRGWKVTLLEKSDSSAMGASGNMLGIIKPRLDLNFGQDWNFNLNAFLYTIFRLTQIKKKFKNFDWFQSGVFECDGRRSIDDIEELNTSIVRKINTDETKQLCGIQLKQSGFHFPLGGWVNPVQLCNILLTEKENSICLKLGQEVVGLELSANKWEIITKDCNRYHADIVIVANSFNCVEFDQCLFPMEKVRGQLTYVTLNNTFENLKMPLSCNGYILPKYQHQHVVGATYQLNDSTIELSVEDHSQNLAKLQHIVKNYLPIPKDEIETLGGRVSFRAVARDHMPIVGAVPDRTYLLNEYKNLRHGNAHQTYPPAKYVPGLYISAGHGSYGLTTSLLSAEIIAALICGEPQPVQSELLHRIHPARFMIRDLKKDRSE